MCCGKIENENVDKSAKGTAPQFIGEQSRRQNRPSIQLTRKGFSSRNRSHRPEGRAVYRPRRDVPEEVDGPVAEQEVRAVRVLAVGIVQIPARRAVVRTGVDENQIARFLTQFAGDGGGIVGALIAIPGVDRANPRAFDVGERPFLDEDRIAGPVGDVSETD
jgi:hypothetical protein